MNREVVRTMFNQVRIYPYKMGSNSASLLAEAIRDRGHRAFKVFPNRRYNPRRRHLVINWGSSTQPEWAIPMDMLNPPDLLEIASNKLYAFRRMMEEGVSIPEFTEDPHEANNWANTGSLVVGRRLLKGHSGAGVQIYEPCGGGAIQYGLPLYTKYVKKSAEYRVHIFNDKVIDVQQKKKKRDIGNEEVDYQVRSYANGWVFCREDIHPPESVLRESLNAVSALGLDFGAVDVIWNEHYQRAYVLEVNTAPGLEGETVNKYADAIIGVMNNE